MLTSPHQQTVEDLRLRTEMQGSKTKTKVCLGMSPGAQKHCVSWAKSPWQ